MKIIQSFWSKPAFHNEQNFQNNRKIGGWLEYKHFLMSSCLSCLTLRRHHSKIELFTDNKGYDIFINQLNLPYDNVSTVLNELDNADHRLWTLGILKTFELQEKPFIHVDNDIYIWEPILTSNASDFLIAQSKHPIMKMYQDSLIEINAHLSEIPSHLSKKIEDYKNFSNVGLIGGNDISFFHNHCEKAYNFIEANKTNLEKINIGVFCMVVEEFFISCLLNERDNVHYHIDSSNDARLWDSVTRFHLTPVLHKYIHLLGEFKKNIYACKQLELRLKYEFPNYHQKVLDVLESEKIRVDDSQTLFYNAKENRIFTAIKKLYNLNMNQIRNIKIQLSEDHCLGKQEDKTNRVSTLSIHETNPITKEQTYRPMTNSDKILFYFQEPITINEVLEQIKNDYNFSKNEFQNIEKNITDIVFEQIVSFGILEFKS